MLQRIRDKSSGPLAYAVVALISLVFGVWGIGSYFTDSPNPVVAEVGGAEITKYQLDRAYDQRYQRLQQLMGENFNHDVVDPAQFKREVLQGLLEREMLSQYSRDMGYRVTDSLLLQSLADDRRFQVDGKFSPDRYTAMLSQSRITPAQYEAGVRVDLQLEQVRGTVLESAFVAPPEARLHYQLNNQQRQFAYLSFDPEKYVDAIELTDDEVQAYFQENRSRYLRPERVKLAYLELDKNQLEVAEKPEPEYLRTLYKQEKSARFSTPERRKARHILVRIDQDTDADAARQKILELKKQLDAGADFADLARNDSDDESTAPEGGSLDWVTRGSMVKPFEDALFAMEPNSISQPVRSDFGWHLIQLREVEESVVKPFEDETVQTELTDLFQSQEREEHYRQLSERLDALSFEAPNSLEPIAEELGLEIQQTDWITRNNRDGQGLGRYVGVIAAAFSDSVLKDNLNSTPVQLGADRQVIVRVIEHQDAQQQALDEVRERVRAQLRNERATQKAREQAQTALQALESGQPINEYAATTQAELVDAQWVTRDAESPPRPVLSTLFSMNPEAEPAPVELAELGARGFAVVKLLGVKEAEADAVLSDNETLLQNVRGRVAGMEYAAFMSQLRKEFDVQINENRIN